MISKKVHHRQGKDAMHTPFVPLKSLEEWWAVPDPGGPSGQDQHQI